MFVLGDGLVGAGFVDNLAVQTDNLSSKSARTVVSGEPALREVFPPQVTGEPGGLVRTNYFIYD
ncbi:MAG: hypothetical protein IGS49_21950 [Chlorogloeopsis fritschii C42_A2020_084]|uniref:hypothetical protein n=1 Tax=Chlorogloeopsis fritschii TaxID=1124 RepID=UPI0019FA4E5D|nr:hypothetical protein [Chlorogloeopsis fritschii]MBF2008032.1 hypothetical protein [Chlorogloeopsis fritschii C42_A2020_084]